ncbi:hypothetical protein AVEN_87596-1 [Araneus ventricosus]|uniref:THAP-type domain-containing protein n=1 Tax=Araneus ventricosus TaxID=182803 RepID=A0A4Y2LV08_ARAVE|nr:hypothetical protein AVEN_87596-1 [Araneus ventricosus]
MDYNSQRIHRDFSRFKQFCYPGRADRHSEGNKIRNRPNNLASIWSDSQSSLKALLNGKTLSQIAREIKSLLHTNKDIRLKAHAGRLGNEMADILAKEAITSPRAEKLNVPVTRSYLKRKLRVLFSLMEDMCTSLDSFGQFTLLPIATCWQIIDWHHHTVYPKLKEENERYKKALGETRSLLRAAKEQIEDWRTLIQDLTYSVETERLNSSKNSSSEILTAGAEEATRVKHEKDLKDFQEANTNAMVVLTNSMTEEIVQKMPNTCCVTNCRGNYDAESKVAVFSFPKDEELKLKWIKAIPRRDLVATKNTKFEEENAVQTASFSILRKIYDIESSELLKSGIGLTRKALWPTNLERQNVSLALKIFSSNLVKGLLELGKISIGKHESRFGQCRSISGDQYDISIRQLHETENKLRINKELTLISYTSGSFDLDLFDNSDQDENSVEIDDFLRTLKFLI